MTELSAIKYELYMSWIKDVIRLLWNKEVASSYRFRCFVRNWFYINKIVLDPYSASLTRMEIELLLNNIVFFLFELCNRQ